MGSDEAALVQLWREKRGEVGPEDISGNLIVQLEAVTEELNRRWYEANTGQTAPDLATPGQQPSRPEGPKQNSNGPLNGGGNGGGGGWGPNGGRHHGPRTPAGRRIGKLDPGSDIRRSAGWPRPWTGRGGVRSQVHAAVVILGGSGRREVHAAAAAQHAGGGGEVGGALGAELRDRLIAEINAMMRLHFGRTDVCLKRTGSRQPMPCASRIPSRRFAQSRALGRKVSDEFVVPLVPGSPSRGPPTRR